MPPSHRGCGDRCWSFKLNPSTLGLGQGLAGVVSHRDCGLEDSRSTASPFPRCVLAGLVQTLAQPFPISFLQVANLPVLTVQGGGPCPEPRATVQAGEGASQGSGGTQKHQSCPFPSGEGESDQMQDFLGGLVGS